MNLDRLIQEGLVEQVKKDKRKAASGVRRAKQDIKTALRNLKFDPEWAFTIAYHAILRASMALMSFEGYRPKGKNQHKTVVKYCKNRLGKRFKKLVNIFDRMRRKRHNFVYGITSISEIEAEDYIKEAQRILKIISSKIKRKR